MPKRATTHRGAYAPDVAKFENIHQLGGIRTGTLDTPGAGGGPGGRVALVDTGAGFRFTVALDRGGDIIDAHYNAHGLAYLTPVGLRPPGHAYHRDAEWLANWPGGLVTTCGPDHIGGPRVEHGVMTSLHGRFSNTPAVVETLRNPDPQRGEFGLELGLVIRDTRMFGPVIEVRRRMHATLGQPEVTIEDEVMNRGDTPTPHHWLYHCNFGYPLLDTGTRFIYRGQAEYWVVPPPAGQDIVQPISRTEAMQLKRVPPALREHAGTGERGLIVETEPERDGVCRVGVINDPLKLGVELRFSADALPRMAHWQHYGPRGSYVTALEPFYGSLLGLARDRHHAADPMLEPGESRRYQLKIRVLGRVDELNDLKTCDGTVIPARRIS